MALEPLAPVPLPVAPTARIGLHRWAADMVRALSLGLNKITRRLNFTYPEEGTWTPVITASSTAGTPVYSVQGGIYTRVGNDVMFWGMIQLSNWTGTPAGNVSITGLPYTAAASTELNTMTSFGFPVVWRTGVNLSAGYSTLGLILANNTSELFLRERGDNVTEAAVQASAIATSLFLRFGGVYRAADRTI